MKTINYETYYDSDFNAYYVKDSQGRESKGFETEEEAHNHMMFVAWGNDL